MQVVGSFGFGAKFLKWRLKTIRKVTGQRVLRTASFKCVVVKGTKGLSITVPRAWGNLLPGPKVTA